MGTFVNANIEGRLFNNVVRLPRHLLRAGNLLWIVDETSRLRNRQVSILRTGGDDLYVVSGLDNGDRVSLTVLDDSFDGAQVNVVSSTPSDELEFPASSEAPAQPNLSDKVQRVSSNAASRQRESTGSAEQG
jgi:hypothetical protein